MNKTDLCETLQREIGKSYTCEDQGDYQRIHTPFLYPDGDCIDLYCRIDDQKITVTDLAETTRWLRSQTAVQKRSSKQRDLIEDICLTLGIEFSSGMLRASCRSEKDLTDVVTRVAQAALRVSDIWLTYHTRSTMQVSDEVADFLSENDISFARSEKMSGHSGRDWTVDFHVRADVYGFLVFVLSTGNRSAARSVSEHVLTAWYDLNYLRETHKNFDFISLFDDTTDVWSDEDFRLLEELSTIKYWSRPDEFATYLKEAS